MKSKWSVELTVYQDQLHLVTFWEVIECNLCMPCVHIHGSPQCTVEKAPTGSQLPTMLFYFILFYFFIFLLLKKWYELSVEFGSEKYAETWEFGLRQFNKSRNGQFWIRNLDLPCVTNCHTWFKRGGRQLWVVTQGQLFNEPRLVSPVLELVLMTLMKWGDVMICAGTDLWLFFAVCTDEMT